MFLKNFSDNSPAPVQSDSPTKPVAKTKKKKPTISKLSLSSATVTDGPNHKNHVTIKTTTNNTTVNAKGRIPMTIPQYDLNGDRDFMYFNVTEYKDKKWNRIGSKGDGKLLEKTLKKKNFELRAFLEGEITQKAVVNKLDSYLKKLENGKRNKGMEI